jgi:hypothetical protein
MKQKQACDVIHINRSCKDLKSHENLKLNYCMRIVLENIFEKNDVNEHIWAKSFVSDVTSQN